MELILNLLDFIMHIDKYLVPIIEVYGIWTYLILFSIIFSETGFVVTPFLPGDSLLFFAGALGAAGSLNMKLLILVFIAAAIAGNTLNYTVGKIAGFKITRQNRFIKKEYLDKTQLFYKTFGGKTIIVSRFLPVIRSFAPFVAGICEMPFRRFILFNSIGGSLWVLVFTLSGYAFGNIPLVKNNLSIVIGTIILASLVPTALSLIVNKPKIQRQVDYN
jgi:membrane-associated protein